ncbi:MAG: VWA domain-containing protein [Treponema sp.]|nr:VWA domain-containing protein [Treponema sp.]
MDLVLVLDNSSSMSSSYRETLNYITGPFLKEFLRVGDTFHLISFSDIPRAEISRRIEGVGDMEIIIGRMLLMYPLIPYSDIPGALDFAEQYVSSLPAGRPKKVVFITDGDQSPRPGTGQSMEGAAVQSLLNGAVSRFIRRGAEFYLVKFPLAGSGPSSGRGGSRTPPARTAAPDESAAPAPERTAAQAAPRESVPSGSQDPVPVQSAEAVEEAAESAAVTGESPQAADTTPAGTASGSGTVSPEAGSVSADTASPSTPGLRDFPVSLPILIGLIAVLLLILALIIFLVVRRLQSSPNRAMANAALASGNRPISQEEAAKHKDQSAARNAELLESYAASQRPGTPNAPRRTPLYNAPNQPTEGPPLLNLYVDGQSTAIGRRNIHNAKAGITFTIGGGNSDFLIFFVNIPPHIAEVRYDGNQCTFYPRKPQYFPDTGSQVISNCIGQAVRVISDKKYEFFIRVDRYQDPLIALNRLLHSIEVPEETAV